MDILRELKNIYSELLAHYTVTVVDEYADCKGKHKELLFRNDECFYSVHTCDGEPVEIKRIG